MTRDEYRELMEYLAEERLRRSRSWRHRHFLMEMELYDELIEEMAPGYATRGLDHRRDIAHDARYIRAVRRTLDRSTDIAEDIGMLDIIEEYDGLIIEGMLFEDLPAQDLDALRRLGETNARGALLASFHKVKHRGSVNPTQPQYERIEISKSLRSIETRLGEVESTLRETTDDSPEPSRPSRRWFKGLGKIAQGAALTMADVCLAGGLLVLPVDPSTQTWGAIVSSITGVGTVLDGAGELRGE